MKLDEFKIWFAKQQEVVSFGWKKYRNLIIAGVLALILLISGVLAFTDWLGNWIDMRKIFKWNTNINALANEVNGINANLQLLNSENSAMGREVNALGENYNRAINATDESRRRTNRTLQNLNRIGHRDFNGTSLEEANRLRCQANPSAPECRK